MFTWEIMSSMFKNPNHVLLTDTVVIMKEITSWLFKDPINSGMAQLDMPNQKVKNDLKDKKTKLPQMNYFLEKQLIKCSCTYWPLLFLQNF